MGQNRRYPSLLAENIDHAVARQHRLPISLAEEELDKSNHTLKRPPEGIPVRVWVHFTDGSVERVQKALAVAYTSKAVFIESKDVNGKQFGIWVWANAVERVQPRELS